MTEQLFQILKSLPKPKPQGDPRTLNAYRHGLTGHVRFTTPADERAYQKHCAGYLADFNPKGAVETDLAQSIADYRWRLKRAAQMENAIVAITLGRPDMMKCDIEEAAIAYSHATAWLDRGKDLNLLTLYERRIQRAFQEDFQLLEQIQQRRRQQEQTAAEPAQAAQAAAVPAPPPPARRRHEPKLVFSTRPKHSRHSVPSPPPAGKLAA
jgi:hypothetical protein